MFQVRFYTFSKKQNSTAVPSGTYTLYNCTAKNPLSVLSPVVVLRTANAAEDNPSAFNYAYIPQFNRYYHINEWTNDGPLWIARMTVDALASWKTEIGSQSCYVYRAASSYDSLIPDDLYPTKNRLDVQNVALPKVWTIGGVNYNSDLENSGFFVVGVIGKNGTIYWGMPPATFDVFMRCIYSDDYYEDILGAFGATEYPEAKVAINPAQYISSVKFVPGSLLNGASSTPGQWGVYYKDISTAMYVGPAYVDWTVSDPGKFAYQLTSGTYPTYQKSSKFDIYMLDYRHPQSDVRGDWLNFAPYSTYELFYPPFGLIELDPVEINNASMNRLRVDLNLDPRSCIATLTVQVFAGVDPSLNTSLRTIVRMEAPFGVSVPVSAIMVPGTSAIQVLSSTLGSALGGIVGMAKGNAPGAVAGFGGAALTGIGTAINGKIPHVSTFGGPGNVSSLNGDPKLYVTHWYVVDDDLADKGRPLCQTKTISTLSGYIMADSDHISIACTSDELNTIKAAVSSGFYYE